MPKRQRTPCAHRGCPQLTYGHYCLDHKRRYTREEVAGRRERTRIYDSKQWRSLRMMHLRRQPLCQMCGGAGGTVDHVKPVEQGGEMWDGQNLQTLCFDCHQTKRAKEAQMKARGEKYGDNSQITIVAGPPGSGKTSYVRERARYGDLILDLDRLFVALTGLEKHDKPDAILPIALATYEFIISQLSTSIGDIRHVWVIASAPKRERRMQLKNLLNAEVVLLDVDPLVCVKRIGEDPLRSAQKAQWTEVVKKWWENYEPDEKEISYA